MAVCAGLVWAGFGFGTCVGRVREVEDPGVEEDPTGPGGEAAVGEGAPRDRETTARAPPHIYIYIYIYNTPSFPDWGRAQRPVRRGDREARRGGAAAQGKEEVEVPAEVLPQGRLLPGRRARQGDR